MKSLTTIGLIWAFSFVMLEAVQAVFFGGVFQNYDSFLIGVAVFGLSALATLVWAGLRTPEQLHIAFSNRTSLLGLNLSTTVVWIAYFFALQMIEPAVVFMLFSGLIPISVLVAARLGVPEATPLRNGMEKAGMIVIGTGLGYLCSITLMGHSGFVRGGFLTAVIGLILSTTAAVSLSVMMIYSQRLDRLGVAPIAQYGLRFPLYIAVALCAVVLGIDAKGSEDPQGLIVVICIGLVVIAFPVFTMQKAISMLSTGTLATITALGPLAVFALQLAEGRVAYASATMIGLAIYSAGSLLAALAATRPVTGRMVSS